MEVQCALHRLMLLRVKRCTPELAKQCYMPSAITGIAEHVVADCMQRLT